MPCRKFGQLDERENRATARLEKNKPQDDEAAAFIYWQAFELLRSHLRIRNSVPPISLYLLKSNLPHLLIVFVWILPITRLVPEHVGNVSKRIGRRTLARPRANTTVLEWE